MDIERAARLLQTYYPRIYLACHTHHQRKKTTTYRLSPRDSSILAHLETDSPTSLSQLAKHMSLGLPTLSEATKRLCSKGYVTKILAEDKRTARLLLTPRGVEAIAATSVLETERLKAVLKGLSKRELQTVIAGFGRLAKACERK